MIDFEKMNTESRNILGGGNKKTNKVGRKPLNDEDKKSEKITIYLTKSEREIFENKASADNRKLNDFIVQKVLNG